VRLLAAAVHVQWMQLGLGRYNSWLCFVKLIIIQLVVLVVLINVCTSIIELLNFLPKFKKTMDSIVCEDPLDLKIPSMHYLPLGGVLRIRASPLASLKK
jgi:hypothetical protein